MVYRLTGFFPEKCLKPGQLLCIISHSFLITKICNITQLLLFSFVLNSHQQQRLALVNKTRNKIWLLPIPMRTACSYAPHTFTALLLSSTLTRKFLLGICQLHYWSQRNTSWTAFLLLQIILFFKSSSKAFHITKVKLTSFHFLDQKGFKV